MITCRYNAITCIVSYQNILRIKKSIWNVQIAIHIHAINYLNLVQNLQKIIFFNIEIQTRLVNMYNWMRFTILVCTDTLVIIMSRKANWNQIQSQHKYIEKKCKYLGDICIWMLWIFFKLIYLCNILCFL